ncbi:hypothetical protein E4P41_03850 [Geodermatophilus sp. DF01-2]|uniref:hypothetical protein n=1 Tax=Geodermatophilus sp. DF01-2 TaxID=2559610 RepID=UPI00107328C2|nr:hypothetical protein [Geodermatophilus sp. DF01_2]TFV63626.1 hypothetical protein E4P41_03850 [Geodermatophilus sp. DF01_2]
MTALLFVALTGCSGESQQPAQSSTEPTDVYVSPVVDCLDQLGIPYRTTDLPDGGQEIVPVGDAVDDPQIQACLTGANGQGVGPEASGQNSAAESNSGIRAIAECLREAGWHATVVEDPAITYGDGSRALAYSVPDAERADPSFAADESSCTEEVLDQ